MLFSLLDPVSGGQWLVLNVVPTKTHSTFDALSAFVLGV